MFSKNADKVFFFASAAVVVLVAVFGYGYAIANWEIWPYRTLETIKGHVSGLIKLGKWDPVGRYIKAPAMASREANVVHRPDKFMPGYRAIMAWDGGKDLYVIRLFDDSGELVHQWDIDYSALDPSGPSRGREEPHGMSMLPDGSVLVNFDFGEVLARLDACGQPIWVNEGIYHHSIDRGLDGSYWTWRADNSPYGHYHYLTNFDGMTGEIIQELDMTKDFIGHSDDQAAIFSVPKGFELRPVGGEDIFHPNDIETLQPELADAFPEFAVGDLMISLRANNLVAVLDPVGKTVKWASHGPWQQQHDPDFTSEGEIIVYSNNRAHRISSIMSIDPTSNEVKISPTSEEARFFSDTAGEVQRLPNGNLFIVVPNEGRVLETTWSGELVYEYNNYVSDKVNAYVANGVWLPEGFFDQVPSCPSNERPASE